MPGKQWALLKWSSLGVSVGSIMIAVFFLLDASKSRVMDEPEQAGQPEQQEPQQAQTKVEKPLIVERKGEKIIWRLQADEATQLQQGMHLIKPRLEMFTEAGELIPIQGSEAWFEPLRKNIRFKGAVQAGYREWALHSEELYYESGRDELTVPGKFTLVKPEITLRGRGLRVDRKTEQLRVDHDVWLEDRGGRSFGGSR
jgi:hypothetical protein